MARKSTKNMMLQQKDYNESIWKLTKTMNRYSVRWCCRGATSVAPGEQAFSRRCGRQR